MLNKIDGFVNCEKKFHVYEIFHNQTVKNDESIMAAISEIANDSSDQERIINLFQNKILKAISKNEETDIGLLACYNSVLMKERENPIDSKEWVLSAAVFCNSMAVNFFESGGIEDAFDQLFEVSYYLGMLSGNQVADFTSLKQRQKISRKALFNRHKANREMKEFVIHFYKENYKQFKNKDKVALHLEEKTPYAFSTIRDWLKGVNAC